MSTSQVKSWWLALCTRSLLSLSAFQAAAAKFKKVKKKVRKIRKKEILKADDLLPLPDQTAEPTDYGSR